MLRRTACKFSLVFCLLIVNLALAKSFAANTKTITISSTDYPPLFQSDELGLMEQLVSAAFKNVGYKINFIYLPYTRAMVEFLNSRFDAVIPGKGHFPDHQHLMTDHWMLNTEAVFFYYKPKTKNFSYKGLNDLKGHLISISSARGMDNQLLQRKGIKTFVVDNPKNQFMLLKIGRNKFASQSNLVGRYYIEKFFPENEKDFGYTKAFLLGALSIAFLKSKPLHDQFSQDFKKGFEMIKKSGLYLRIIKKAYGDQEPPKVIFDKKYLPDFLQ